MRYSYIVKICLLILVKKKKSLLMSNRGWRLMVIDGFGASKVWLAFGSPILFFVLMPLIDGNSV